MDMTADQPGGGSEQDHAGVESVEGFGCKFCGKRFQRKSVQKRHEASHSETVKTYMCADVIKTKLFENQKAAHTGCDKEFKTKQQASNHIKSQHFKVSLKCEVCDVKFQNSDALSYHRKSKHNKKKICNICNLPKELTSLQFTEHIRECEKEKLNSELEKVQREVNDVKSKIEENLPKCSICFKIFEDEVFTCKSGHWICKSCGIQNYLTWSKNTCGQCRTDLKLIRIIDVKNSLQEMKKILNMTNESESASDEYIEDCKAQNAALKRQFAQQTLKINSTNDLMKGSKVESVNLKILKNVFAGEVGQSQKIKEFIFCFHFNNKVTKEEMTNQLETVLKDKELKEQLKLAGNKWGNRFRTVENHNCVNYSSFQFYQEIGNQLLLDDNFKILAIMAIGDNLKQQKEIEGYLSQFKHDNVLPQVHAPHLIEEDHQLAVSLQQQFNRESSSASVPVSNNPGANAREQVNGGARVGLEGEGGVNGVRVFGGWTPDATSHSRPNGGGFWVDRSLPVGASAARAGNTAAGEGPAGASAASSVSTAGAGTRSGLPPGIRLITPGLITLDDDENTSSSSDEEDYDESLYIDSVETVSD